MKLQVALDLCSLDEAVGLTETLRDLVDIVEVGTPIVLRDGMEAVRRVKRVAGDTPVLADLKIVDAGEHEAAIGFDAGADWVTVLGVADDATIDGAVRAARAAGGRLLADMISVPNVVERGAGLVQRDVDLVCVHTAYDRQAFGADPLDELTAMVTRIARDRIAVAGGINGDKISQVAPLGPAVVVVGGAIAGAADVRAAAEAMRIAMEGGACE